MTRSETADLWTDRMRRFQQAEMTVAQFCTAEGVSQPSFYNWRRRLLSSPGSSASGVAKFVPVQMQTPPDPLRGSANRVRTTIELPGGIRICVEVPSETLSNQAHQTRP